MHREEKRKELERKIWLELALPRYVPVLNMWTGFFQNDRNT